MNHADEARFRSQRRANSARRRLQTQTRRAYLLLRSGIRSGAYQPEEVLVEDQLIELLATSRNAVRQALQMLAEEGLVDRSPRRGTSVSNSLNLALDQRRRPATGGLSTELSWRGADVEATKVESRTVPCTSHIQTRLALLPGDLVRMDEYLVTADGEPVAVRVGYIPADITAGDYTPVPRHRSVIFERRFKAAFGRSEDSIEAVACEERTARLLGVKEGSPILLVETLSVDAEDVPRELSYNYNRGDRVSILTSALAPDSAGLE